MDIVLPAFFAGLVAVAVTVAIERFGGRVGGFLGTLPTTIVPASLGMFADDPAVFRDALSIAPAGMLVNALFLWSWRVLPDRLPATLDLRARLGAMVVLTLGLWAVGASAVLGVTGTLTRSGAAPEAIGALATLAIVGIGALACRAGVPAPRGARRVGPVALVARGVLAGGAIGLAVAIARSGHGLLAGVASVFPAIFLTSMVSVWWSQGRAVSAGAVGPMMLGSASVAAYALIAAFTLPALGPVLGVLSAWILAVGGVTLPSNAWVASRSGAADQR